MSLTEYSTTHITKYDELYEIYRAHEAAHWIFEEVSMNVDVEQWKTGKITDGEKNLLENILRLFTTSDFVIEEAYLDKLIPYIKNSEARTMLCSFANRENEHVFGYALLSDTLGFGEKFYLEFKDYAEMSEKVEFMTNRLGDSPKEFAQYLAKQTLIEGVNLFASFAVLLNFDRMGKMPGMIDIIKWSVRDESFHCQGLSKLFRIFTEENPEVVSDDFKREIYDTARLLVDLEDQFIDKAFEMGGVEGMEPEEVKQYIRYIADFRLAQLGFKPNWDIERNPFPWVDAITGDSAAAFFERSVSNYQAANFPGGHTYSFIKSDS